MYSSIPNGTEIQAHPATALMVSSLTRNRMLPDAGAGELTIRSPSLTNGTSRASCKGDKSWFTS